MGVASKYFVADLPGAITPATRLHNILASLEQGRRLSEQALMYLQNQELAALKQLAQGEISYDAFSQIAAEELVKREQVAEAERRKKEAALLRLFEQEKAQEAIRKAEYERKRQQAEEARRQRESDPK